MNYKKSGLIVGGAILATYVGLFIHNQIYGSKYLGPDEPPNMKTEIIPCLQAIEQNKVNPNSGIHHRLISVGDYTIRLSGSQVLSRKESRTDDEIFFVDVMKLNEQTRKETLSTLNLATTIGDVVNK